MAETLILDPTELDSTRTQLDITPWVSQAGIDYGDAAVQLYAAEQAVGSTAVDIRYPNRTIQVPLSLRDVGGTTFATIRSTIQAKMGLWQKQGGYIRRNLPSGGTVYADIVSATLKFGGGWLQAQTTGADIEASLTLEAVPDWYGPEQTLSDHVETSAAELIFTETTVTGGDFPLGDRVRIVVDEDQGQDQRGLIWGFRGMHYDSATTAALAYEAEAMQPLDTAAKAAKVGASGGTVVTHGTLSTNWTPVLGTNLAGTQYLTHVGAYRMWARVFTTSGTAVRARAVYDVGDLVNPAENSAVRCYDGGTFHILDLGQLQLNKTTGTHRWQGQIQAAGDVGGENFSVDRVWMQPLDESAGLLQAPVSITPGLTSYLARDDFNQTAGNIDAPKAAAAGGNWGEAIKTGANGFQVETSGNTLQRTVVSDASQFAGAAAFVGSAVSLCAVKVDYKISAIPTLGAGYHGVLARYVDASNWLSLSAVTLLTGGVVFQLWKYVAGVATTLLPGAGNLTASLGQYRTILLYVDASGYWEARQYTGSTIGPVIGRGVDSDLATGGALASGKVGVYDAWTSSAACTRNYDNFAAWVPAKDAVVYASRSVELATNGIRRQDTGGTAYGPVSVVSGDLSRIPNRAHAGTVDALVKMSRGDIESINDPAIDDLSAKVYRRPSYLQVG